jgi:hypothetical protein
MSLEWKKSTAASQAPSLLAVENGSEKLLLYTRHRSENLMYRNVVLELVYKSNLLSVMVRLLVASKCIIPVMLNLHLDIYRALLHHISELLNPMKLESISVIFDESMSKSIAVLLKKGLIKVTFSK